MTKTTYQEQRARMINEQLIARGIDDDAVLEAFRTVPREKFVPQERREDAYRDGPLPIGEGQTISQPYIVASMIQALQPKPEDKILEVGIGSGYAAAVLSRVVESVYGVERYSSLGQQAEERLREVECTNVEVHIGDGTKGWSKEAPYDGIMVSAAAPGIPDELLEQLVVGGCLVIPAGKKQVQQLYQVEKLNDGELKKKELGRVRFVPLVGENGW